MSKMTGEVSTGMEVVAPGNMIMSVIYFMSAVSGAHINPVVTIAFTLRAFFMEADAAVCYFINHRRCMHRM